MIPGNKEKCSCGRLAQWIYMPGYSSGSSPYVCNECISGVDRIGCSCNWEHMGSDYSEDPIGEEGIDWKYVLSEGGNDDYIGKITKEDGVWQYLDEQGRPYPCVEYDYSEEGFDLEEEDETQNTNI
jgi:hypothetical protein